MDAMKLLFSVSDTMNETGTKPSETDFGETVETILKP